MRKIILFLLVSIFSLSFVYAWGCSYNNWSDTQTSLKSCLSDTTLINAQGNLKTTWDNFSKKIYDITKIIATILSLGAVFWIVYWSFLMVTAAWEDEKIKKWKDVIKWAIIGFLWVVLASSLIVLITKFIFDLKS
jgi:hypothetical protein